MKANNIVIGRRQIGTGFPVYIVAELSANHRQQFTEAVNLVKAAREAGADAVKLQTYTQDTLTIPSDRPEFRIGGGTLWDGKTLFDLYGEAYTPWEWQPKLKKIADKSGLTLFSSPFDRTAVDFLDKMDVPAFKIASFEIVDIPLIEYAAGKRRPLLISTGLASPAEIEAAVQAARNSGASEIALLKCTSAYPAPAEEMNLKTIPHMIKKFGLPVGISDHTPGIAVPVAAVTLGACIIEKHFTLSRSKSSPDSAFSLEPAEFKQMVEAVRTTEKALGKACYGPGTEEAKSLVFRRSLYVVKDIKAGEKITEENVRSIRPGCGLHPGYLKDILGRRAAQNISRGTPFDWSMI
jgi:pseudaminic acid synthase